MTADMKTSRTPGAATKRLDCEDDGLVGTRNLLPHSDRCLIWQLKERSFAFRFRLGIDTSGVEGNMMM